MITPVHSGTGPSLPVAVARNLATAAGPVPPTRGSDRWLLRRLPWVDVTAGRYRANGRPGERAGAGRVAFYDTLGEVEAVPASLREVALFRGCTDSDLLATVAGCLVPEEFAPGDVIVSAGRPAEALFLIAQGKVAKIGAGRYGNRTNLDILADGDHFGSEPVTDPRGNWEYTMKALTPVTTLTLTRTDLQRLAKLSRPLREQVERLRHRSTCDSCDDEPSTREYELSATQAVLRVPARAYDLYRQTGRWLRLTVEALRERQEHELLNNPRFGLLHNAAQNQRVHTRSGPPAPDDLDELLARRHGTEFFLAHPRAIAAFGRECSARGIAPATVEVDGKPFPAWRGLPLLPCDKILVSWQGTSSILAMRTGERNRGVVGLRRRRIPDEIEPGVSARLSGAGERSYLVVAYYSVAVLAPDALGVLENVEIAHGNG
ncbi:cyclic nucleotide-binding domain-containing protein [Amycolatopsis taiwanensis]|uniref:cyclic nucleotide-binding domain-containing protein n=1 Tax=Amycolatopsis taiwanensis TaxID=342230 RepID=UPI0004859A9F|nr:cyclic nucleotide-binding domain-containing protein [Amycolatopsis taiwanensis]